MPVCVAPLESCSRDAALGGGGCRGGETSPTNFEGSSSSTCTPRSRSWYGLVALMRRRGYRRGDSGGTREVRPKAERRSGLLGGRRPAVRGREMATRAGADRGSSAPVGIRAR